VAAGRGRASREVYVATVGTNLASAVFGVSPTNDALLAQLS